MTEVATDDLQGLVAAAREADSPHVDLSGLLGVHARVGLEDLHELLLATGDGPAVHLEFGRTELTVRRQDGGMLATLALSW